MSTYWMAIAGCALLSFALTAAQKNRYHLKWNTVILFGCLAVPLALLAGRGVYFLVSLDWIVSRQIPFWQMAEGKFLLYGAVLGGILAAVTAAGATRQRTAGILDAAAAGAALMIAGERFCEYLIGMGYGIGIQEWFDPIYEWSMIEWENPEILYRFPFGIQDYYHDWHFAVNLLEGIWAIVIVIVLLKGRQRRPGAAAVRMMAMYAAGQIVLESLRKDEVLKWSFVQVNQLLSAVILVGLLLLCWILQDAEVRKWRELLLSVGGILLLAGVVILMEFALDQKIVFLYWMRGDVSYLIEALCCVGMLLLVMKAWRKGFPILAEDAGKGSRK